MLGSSRDALTGEVNYEHFLQQIGTDERFHRRSLNLHGLPPPPPPPSEREVLVEIAQAARSACELRMFCAVCPETPRGFIFLDDS